MRGAEMTGAGELEGFAQVLLPGSGWLEGVCVCF